MSSCTTTTTTTTTNDNNNSNINTHDNKTNNTNNTSNNNTNNHNMCLPFSPKVVRPKIVEIRSAFVSFRQCSPNLSDLKLAGALPAGQRGEELEERLY